MADQPSEDRRARRSRAALRAALLDLITERGLNRIAVSDVTKRADVNRSTFYEHYGDVHELAADACTQMFDELIAATPVLLPDGTPRQLDRGRAALTGVLAHIAERADLYRALLGPDGSARVADHLHQRLTIAVHVNLTRPAVGTHADDPARIAHDPVAAFLAGGVLGVATDWLRRGCPGTPEQLSAALMARLPIDGSPS
ncbi:TetR/AcrR family transcriptional regulator [Spirillospora sp. NPDC046719]